MSTTPGASISVDVIELFVPMPRKEHFSMMSTLRQRLRNDQAGFTLIELLVVIIIIGILLAIAVPSYLGFRNRANNSAAQANVRAAIPAAEAYYSDNGNYTAISVAE